ncbi:carboxylesterase family protein [Opitutus sp. ER46]|uniref:carboxylesterase/lipase family protein n=1 Tax=Opitutus sp. ER46 TaxID=2161864 RepID=UPI000D2F6F04|nr:carboxylesterase family protein [Opitutus sp. ER46]PTY00130.1 carboxylesterase [Opitutus sp. ER46]
MRNPLTFFLTLAAAAALWAQPQTPAPVMTESGLVQGAAEPGLTVYRGVPFAAAPIGALRWRVPQPAARWEGVRAATTFAPDPIQGRAQNGGVSEDCLYLNIWTPAKAATERLPVLVWIYGGGFAFGSTSVPVHNGEHLARRGVVLVSVAYRVGPLGFLAHPELSAESPHHTSGNYGLMDLFAGLRWVQRNIGAFGGDPAKVTIFGESAGGIAVSMLCASPEGKGLFRGAISQSGGSFGPPRPTTYPGENMKRLADAEKAGAAYATRLGAKSLAELRQLPAERFAGTPMGGFWPVIDGWLIPDDQHKLYEAGQYNDVAILVGYNSDEGLSFAREKTADEYEASTRLRYGRFADALLKAYPAEAGKVSWAARNLMRDAAFGWQAWSWAVLQARTGKSPVYFYHLDLHPERRVGGAPANHGTPHGVDVPYVFQTLDRKNPRITAEDFAVSDTLATYWTNFAKTGNPNGEGAVSWPRFTDQDPQVLYLGGQPHVGPVPDAAALKVLDEYFAWRRTPEGEAWAK